MKKSILSLLLVFPFFLSAQILEVRELVSNLPAAPSYFWNVPYNTLEHSFDFKLKNNSGSDKRIIGSKTILSTTTGFVHNFCFGLQCYTGMYSDTVTIAAGDSLPAGLGNFGLKIDFYPNGNTGDAVVKFKLRNVDVPSDTVGILAVYNASIGIEEYSTSSVAIVYPNPVVDFILFDFKDNAGQKENYELTITDLQGIIVTEQIISADNNQTNLSTLSNGIYHYYISAKGKMLQADKLIVKH